MLKRTPGVEYDKRWENGIPHHPKSIALMKRLNELDWELYNGALDLKTGGDGDIGESIMYLMDIYFEEQDANSTTTDAGHVPGRCIR
jgi:hypothetical protein